MPGPLSVNELLSLLVAEEEQVRQAFVNYINQTAGAQGSPEQARALQELVKQIAEHQLSNVDEITQLVETFLDSGIENFANVLPRVMDRVGTATAEELNQVVQRDPLASIVFNPTHPRAAEMAANARMNLIRQMTSQQLEAVRQAVSRAIETGAGPRQIALAIRNSIGLTSQQEAYVQSYRRLLENRDASALERALRDRRFDGRFETSILRDRPLTANQIDTMVERYRANALAMRAETIGRTEALTAYSQAREEATQQMIEQTGMSADQVTRIWNATHDGRTRAWHADMDGQRVGLDEPFTDGLGNDLFFPGDPVAPAETRINCRCTVTYDIAA